MRQQSYERTFIAYTHSNGKVLLMSGKLLVQARNYRRKENI